MKDTGKFDFGSKRYTNREPTSKKHQLTNSDPPSPSSLVLLSTKIEFDVKNYSIFDFNRIPPLAKTPIWKSLSPFVEGKIFWDIYVVLTRQKRDRVPKNEFSVIYGHYKLLERTYG